MVSLTYSTPLLSNPSSSGKWSSPLRDSSPSRAAEETETLLRIDRSSKSVWAKSSHIACHDVPCNIAESNSQGVLIEGKMSRLINTGLLSGTMSMRSVDRQAAQFTAWWRVHWWHGQTILICDCPHVRHMIWMLWAKRLTTNVCCTSSKSHCPIK